MRFGFLFFIIHFSCLPAQEIHPDQWQCHDRHDGYVLGNGQMYLVAGLGKELDRKGKSQLWQRAADNTYQQSI